MEDLIREPQVAGRFYPETQGEIEKLFDRLLARERDSINYELANKKIFGAILPHAGIMYSGYQTIHFFEILRKSSQKFDTFVILHPIHKGGSIKYASDECTRWRTPLGELNLDMEFLNSMHIPKSASFHKFEHSAEVIVPFIQKYVGHSIRIAPIGIAKQNSEVSMEIACSLSEAMNKTGRNICILASSDFSHYVSPAEGKIKDKMVTDSIMRLDSNGIFNAIIKNNISVCGYGPIMTLIDFIVMNHKDIETEILAQGHSGEVHISDSVVDYISVLFYQNTKFNSGMPAY